MPARRPPPAPGPPLGASRSSPPSSSPSSSSSLFDVYIVGGEPLEAAAMLNVAGLIASRYQVAAPSVADGLAGGWCLVAKGVASPEAERFADELGDLGARTETLPAGAPLPGNRATPSSRDARRSPAQPAHQQAPAYAQAIQAALPPRLLDQILSHPLKRAFAGLALALVIGFIPAAYYSFGVSGAEVRRIRARQLQLSEQPGTRPVIDEFDRLESAINQVRRRGLVHTAILWVLVTGIAGAGLSRVGAARGGPAA